MSKAMRTTLGISEIEIGGGRRCCGIIKATSWPWRYNDYNRVGNNDQEEQGRSRYHMFSSLHSLVNNHLLLDFYFSLLPKWLFNSMFCWISRFCFGWQSLTTTLYHILLQVLVLGITYIYESIVFVIYGQPRFLIFLFAFNRFVYIKNGHKLKFSSFICAFVNGHHSLHFISFDSTYVIINDRHFLHFNFVF